VHKIKGKENLKRVAWRLDVGQEDRIRIKSLVFAFAFFEIYFLTCKFFYLTLISLFEYCVDIIFRSYNVEAIRFMWIIK